MPKKFASENPKAAAALERKKASKDEEIRKKEQQEDDEYWRDGDKRIQKKQQKKEEQDRKREEQLNKKAENKALLEKEMSSLKSGKPVHPGKLTRAQIDSSVVSTVKKIEKREDKIVDHQNKPLEENINRIMADGKEARTVEEAIGILSDKPKYLVDKDLEKRAKVAYACFEERRLRELKEDNPALRMSQIKDKINKEWKRSPENPLNYQ